MSNTPATDEAIKGLKKIPHECLLLFEVSRRLEYRLKDQIEANFQLSTRVQSLAVEATELEQKLEIARGELKTSVSGEVIGARLRDYNYEKTRAERAEAALEAKTKDANRAELERREAVKDAEDNARIALACANREAKLKNELQDTQGSLLFAVNTLRVIAGICKGRAGIAKSALVELTGGAKS